VEWKSGTVCYHSNLLPQAIVTTTNFFMLSTWLLSNKQHHYKEFMQCKTYYYVISWVQRESLQAREYLASTRKWCYSNNPIQMWVA